MRSKFIMFQFLIFSICIYANGQSTIDNVLSDVTLNNKTLQAKTRLFESRKLLFKTGLTPENPVVEYEYLSGSSESTGDQHDLTVFQRFDFPTIYSKRNQIAKSQTLLSEVELSACRQDILLEAKIECITIIYLNKLQLQLEARKRHTERILSDFQSMLDKGEGNILDVNKAKLQLIQVKKQYQENISRISGHNTKLTELNGGNEIILSDTVYQDFSEIIDFNQLASDYENSNPLIRMLEQEKILSQQRVELSKSQWLPSMELGYRYQEIPGQKFNGVHAGITIPLWENSNNVRYQKSRTLYAEWNLLDHKSESFYILKSLYEKYLNLKITLTEYQAVFSTFNNTTLLNKAFEAGALTGVQYFMELNYYNEILHDFYETEKEYHETIARLYKHKL